MAGTIEHRWEGTTLVITSDSGTTACDLKGEKGDIGVRGCQGAAGVVNIDSTLTMAGYGADAKAVGDRLDTIEAAVSESGAVKLYEHSYSLGGPLAGGGITVYLTFISKHETKLESAEDFIAYLSEGGYHPAASDCCKVANGYSIPSADAVVFGFHPGIILGMKTNGTNLIFAEIANGEYYELELSFISIFSSFVREVY